VLNVSDPRAVVNTTQLLPPGVSVATAVQVLTLVGPANVGALVAGTVCSVATVSITRCACPLDYGGDACQLPRHYTCSAVLADPMYHACVAVNGFGFRPPVDGDGAAVLTDPAATAPLLARYAGIVAARLEGSGRALPPPPQQAGWQGYGSHDTGIPPCLFWRSGALPAELGGNLTLRFRVSCRFQRGPTSHGAAGTTPLNLTARLTSGAVVVDGSGVPFQARASTPVNSTAWHAVRYVAPGLPPSLSAPAITCNGSVLTAASLATAWRSTFNSTPPSPLPQDGAPWYGLPCVESAAFGYVAGNPATSAAFALSRPPPLPLALRVRLVSTTFPSLTHGTVLVPLPLAALNGSADVAVTLSPAQLPRDADFWMAGRLHGEVSIVHAIPAAWENGTSAAATVAAALSPTTRHPRLVLTSIARFTLDDPAFAPPTVTPMLPLILGVVLGLGIPALLAGGSVWAVVRWRRRAAKVAEREAIVDRSMVAEAEAERELRMGLRGGLRGGTGAPASGGGDDGGDGGVELTQWGATGRR
jgi:hypothetical protein